jgi:hypothetical protein
MVMSYESAPDRASPNAASQPGESQLDYRQRIRLLQAEALERRQEELGAQRSPSKTPTDRIRIWEHVHQLPLPPDPNHRLVAIIASKTDLSLDEVHAEQRQRAADRARPTG